MPALVSSPRRSTTDRSTTDRSTSFHLLVALVAVGGGQDPMAVRTVSAGLCHSASADSVAEPRRCCSVARYALRAFTSQ